MLAQAGELDSLVCPELVEEYQKARLEWFLEDESPEQLRMPGKVSFVYI